MKKIIRKLAIKLIGKEITERYGSESPEIFKNIQYIGGILVTLSLAIPTSPVALPAIIVAHAATIGFVGGTMALIGGLPRKDNIQ